MFSIDSFMTFIKHFMLPNSFMIAFAVAVDIPGIWHSIFICTS